MQRSRYSQKVPWTDPFPFVRETSATYQQRIAFAVLLCLTTLTTSRSNSASIYNNVRRRYRNLSFLVGNTCSSKKNSKRNFKRKFLWSSPGVVFGATSSRSPSTLLYLDIGMASENDASAEELEAPENLIASDTWSTGDRNLFWNREYGTPASPLDVALPVVRTAKIVCLSDPADASNSPLYNEELPEGCEILHVGTTGLDITTLKKAGCNAVFISDGKNARIPLQKLVLELGSDLEWIHSRSAGVDGFFSETLASKFTGIMTNSKGQFSSTLAEYTIAACLFFAKDFPRLLRQKGNKQWDAYPILELRGSTLGVVGFGDIGKAAARLAVAFGMKIIALTRQPRSREDVLQSLPTNDMLDVLLLDSVTNPDALNTLFASSDYILVSTPLTKETKKMIGTEQFQVAKPGSVLINVGRGPVIDEDALIEALRQKQPRRLKGAALDVTTIEPLPSDSPLWELDNVLLSPHNMDMTKTFMLESTEFYKNVQIPRYVRGLPLLNPINIKEGY